MLSFEQACYLVQPFNTSSGIMTRTFVYSRVLTMQQTTKNQIREIESAGFAIHWTLDITILLSGMNFLKKFEFYKLISNYVEFKSKFEKSVGVMFAFLNSFCTRVIMTVILLGFEGCTPFSESRRID